MSRTTEPCWYHFYSYLSKGGLQAPNWLDLYMCDSFVFPSIKSHNGSLDAWSIHRRWPEFQQAKPEAHEFKFSCWTTSVDVISSITKIGEEAFNRIPGDFLTHPNHRFEVAKGERDFASISEPEEKWPSEIRETWPWFANGASQMFVELVHEVCESLDRTDFAQPTDPQALQQFQSYWMQVKESVKALWFDRGKDVFLHHLSMMFGYDPVRIVPSGTFTRGKIEQTHVEFQL